MIKFNAIDWVSKDAFVAFVTPEGEEVKGRRLVIKAFGRDLEGNVVSISVMGFKPYFYVACGPNVDAEGLRMSITNKFSGNMLVDEVEIVSMKPFRKWHNAPVRMAKLTFLTASDFKNGGSALKYATGPELKSILKSLDMKELTTYETGVVPEMRFFHSRNIKPSGWLMVENELSVRYSPVPVVHPGRDYTVWWEDVSCDKDCQDVAPFRVASFDIECTSETRAFPQPIKSYSALCNDIISKWSVTGGSKSTSEIIKDIVKVFKGSEVEGYTKLIFGRNPALFPALPIAEIEEVLLRYSVVPLTKTMRKNLNKHVRSSFEYLFADLQTRFLIPPLAGDRISQIGIAVKELGKSEIKKYLLCLKSCDPIQDVKVTTYDDEYNLLSDFATIIREIDPDIITGYNISTFDFMFIIERCTSLGVVVQDNKYVYKALPYSRLDETRYPETKRVQSVMSSAAFGDVVNDNIYSPGRIAMDVMKIVKRAYSLPGYSLDAVSQAFMTTVVVEVGEDGLVKLENPESIEVGNFCKIGGEKRKVIRNAGDGWLQLDSTVGVKAGDDSGLVKDDIHVNEIFESFEKGPGERAVVGKYCIQDCVLVLHLIDKLSILLDGLSMSNVCSISLGEVFSRGQSIRSYSLVCKECASHGFVVPDLKARNRMTVEDDGKFEGATVLTAIPCVHYDCPTVVLDYASLYPSSIISENISHETIILDVEELAEAHRLGIPTKTITYEDDTDGTTSVYYVDSKHHQGILPLTLTKLLQARKDVRKKMKGMDHDSFSYKVLDGAQKAYKVVANSVYGTLGFVDSKLYFKHLAASVTNTGRAMLGLANIYIQKHFGGHIRYSDTDSAFVQWPLECEGLSKRDMIDTSIKIGKSVSKGLKGIMREPHDLEYEQTLFPLIMLSKKRYIGKEYVDNPDRSEGYKIMGLVLKRRDNPQGLKEIYDRVIKTIIDTDDSSHVCEVIRSQMATILEGKCLIKDFIITKQLKAHYANPDVIAHKTLADRMTARDPGSAPSANDRIEYIYVDPATILGDEYDEKTLKAGNRIESARYLHNKFCPELSWDEFLNTPAHPGMKVDYQHYIDSQFKKPLLQIIELAVENSAMQTSSSNSASRWNIHDVVDADNRRSKRFKEIQDKICQEVFGCKDAS